MKELDALAAVNFEWVSHLDGIYSGPSFDVPELHGEIRATLLAKVRRLKDDPNGRSPLGVVLVGEAGAGKTHLLSALRQEAAQAQAGFVLLDLTDVHDFWENAQLGFLRALYKTGPGGRMQFREILEHLAVHYLGAKDGVAEIDALAEVRPPALINRCNQLIKALFARHPGEAMEHQDVVRALVLVSSSDFEIANLGNGWLQGMGIDEEQKLRHGFHQSQLPPNRLLRSLAWLYSLRGPLVVALDQLDAIVAEHHMASGIDPSDPLLGARQRVSASIIEGIANGLMALRDLTRRSLIVVSCLETTWHVLSTRAIKAAGDRFEPPIFLSRAHRAEVAERLVVARLEEGYARAAFSPPSPSWPFAPAAFQQLALSPRELLKRCDGHVRDCLASGRAFELHSFSARPSDPGKTGRADFGPIDARYKTLLGEVAPAPLDEEAALDRRIEAACTVFALERRPAEQWEIVVDKDFDAPRFDPLHVRLRVIHHDRGERESHYCFRFIEEENAVAFQTRLKAAVTASGIDRALDFRRLCVLRTRPLRLSPKTREMLDEFTARGGERVAPSDDDLRIMGALERLLEEFEPKALIGWLRERQPSTQIGALDGARIWLEACLGGTPVSERPVQASEPDFKVIDLDARRKNEAPSDAQLWPTGTGAVVADLRVPERTRAPEPAQTKDRAPVPELAQAKDQARVPERLRLGVRVQNQTLTQEPVELALERLRKHTVILAGAGSGKTVLLRRIVEEAAILGVPSIVLDAANDLSRLGTPWPVPPAEFSADDRARAERYFAAADPVIWTPGRANGNPLSLDPLPDLRALIGQKDEYDAALDLARALIEPLVLGNRKPPPGRAGLLRAALDGYVKKGGVGIRGFVDFLADLPPENSGDYQKANEHARKMADALREQLTVNAVLRVAGTPLDPGRLLAASEGRARVSVLNLSGLSDLADQQAFVALLAGQLFSWIKANPAKDRPLSGLLVIDEARDFVPSSRTVPCREGLLRLSAQARKYGLGLIFATQAPKSIDHNVIANCATQVYGQANSPAAIEVIEDQIRTRGGTAGQVARLGTGRFFFFTEGLAAPIKIASHMCLSHHPKSPPDESEVLAEAQRSATRLAHEPR